VPIVNAYHVQSTQRTDMNTNTNTVYYMIPATAFAGRYNPGKTFVYLLPASQGCGGKGQPCCTITDRETSSCGPTDCPNGVPLCIDNVCTCSNELRVPAPQPVTGALTICQMNRYGSGCFKGTCVCPQGTVCRRDGDLCVKSTDPVT